MDDCSSGKWIAIIKMEILRISQKPVSWIYGVCTHIVTHISRQIDKGTKKREEVKGENKV
jgi:hypothetical protein